MTWKIHIDDLPEEHRAWSDIGTERRPRYRWESWPAVDQWFKELPSWRA